MHHKLHWRESGHFDGWVFIEAKYVSHVRTKTENVSQNENVQSCHHGANLSLPTNTSVFSKGKGSNPPACNAILSVSALYQNYRVSLFTQHGWAADYGLQEGWVSECSLTSDNIYSDV